MNLFGVSSVELVILLVVVVLTIGPKGLAQALRGFRQAVGFVRSWSARLREEAQRESVDVGLDGLDLSRLDLRQYDPREIVRQAVREEMEAWTAQSAPGSAPATPDPGPRSGHKPQTAP
ncbi:hypothetical protein [Georgenia sp. H159]|uniref:hypothetical protein n=1 Tax=Georgenia sp. H159 TaxID=3076115 RepID=UPI002D77DCAF|nr:hypothetical protein [Georgenia sp. H159]